MAGASNSGFVLARYNVNGSLDTSFDTDGKVMTDFSAHGASALSLAICSDQKIIVGGYDDNGTDDDFALARYNSNGSLDTSFGTGGKVTTDLGGYDSINSVAIVSGDKIVAVGQGGSDDARLDFILACYNTDGSLDTGFGTSGTTTTEFPTAATWARV